MFIYDIRASRGLDPIYMQTRLAKGALHPGGAKKENGFPESQREIFVGHGHAAFFLSISWIIANRR